MDLNQLVSQEDDIVLSEGPLRLLSKLCIWPHECSLRVSKQQSIFSLVGRLNNHICAFEVLSNYNVAIVATIFGV